MHSIDYISLFICILYATNVLSQNQNQCFDHYHSCRNLASNGDCVRNEQQMRRFCSFSCNFCGPPKTIVKPEFECGRPYTQEDDMNTRRKRQINRYPQPGSGASRQGDDNQAGSQINLSVEDVACGATVIHPRFLLTAAHCVLDPTRPISGIRLGDLDLSQDGEANSQAQDYVIEQIFIHPDFDPNLVKRYHDLALLQTDRTIEFNEVVYPFCLSNTRPLPNTAVTGSGFGKVNETSRTPILQEVELSIVDLAECESSYRELNLDSFKRRYPNHLQENGVLCAGYPGRGACEGDEGGPLFQDQEDGRRFLHGVVSFANSCKGTEVSNLPNIFASVADHIDFIDSVVNGI